MYNLKKRAYFTNLGELRMLLADFPDGTEVCTIGVLGSYLHVDEERHLISFDDEPLGDCYPELDDEDIWEENEIREDREHCQRMEQIFGITEAAFIVDDAVIAGAFYVDDGSWDYTILNPDMRIIESGQLSFDCQYSAHEAVIECLKSCGLSYQKMVPIPFEQYQKMCNMEIRDA